MAFASILFLLHHVHLLIHVVIVDEVLDAGLIARLALADEVLGFFGGRVF